MDARTLNFDVRVAAAPGGYEVRSSAPEVGEAVEPFELPFASADIRAIVDELATTAVDGRGSAGRLTLEPVGTRLFEALFRGEVYAAFRRLLDIAGRDGRRVRIRLRLPTELVDLPWEILYFRARRVYVAADRGTPLVRYVELPEPSVPLPVGPPLEVLAVAARVEDLPALDVDAEQRKLESGLGPLTSAGEVRLRWAEDGTLDGLVRALDAGPVHVVHFIGHGEWDASAQAGMLHFESGPGDRRSRPVRADALAAAFRGHASLRMIVLNACEGARSGAPFSGSSLALVAAGVPAVVAMQFAITDEASIAFSGGLYGALADREPVDVAAATARRNMFLGGHDVEWATPVLYMRSGDARLFGDEPEVQPSAAPRIATIATGEVNARNGSPHGVRLDRASAPTAERRQLVRRLPADFVGLLGRAADVRAVGDALAADSFQVYGSVGVGKSSLLRHLANRLPGPADDFVHLRVGGRPVDDIAQRLFEEFYLDTEPPLRPNEAVLHGYLGRVSSLVMLDDVDLVADDVDALLDTAPACRFLLASRSQSLSGPGRSRLLGGLGDEAAAELVARDLGRPLTAEETGAATALARALDGRPGAILEAVARVREGRLTLEALATSVATAVAGAAPAGGPAAAARAEPSDAAAERVRGLLGALGGAPLADEHIRTLTGGVGDVEELQARAVIRANSPRYTLATDAEPPSGPIDPALYELLPHLATWAERSRADPRRVADESEAIVAALRWGVATERWGEVIRLARATEDALFTSRRWGEWSLVLDGAMIAAHKLGDDLEVARTLHQRGTRAVAAGDSETGRADLSRALDAREALGAKEAAALTRHNLRQIPPPAGGDGGGGGGGVPWFQVVAGLGGMVLLLIGLLFALGILPPDEGKVENGQLEADVRELDFGEVEVGQISDEQSLEVRNIGGGPAGNLDLAVEPFVEDFTVSSSCEDTLEPGASCRVTVGFRPAAAGNREATLEVTTDGATDPLVVDLHGVGIAPSQGPAIESDPSIVAFGEVRLGGSADGQMVTIRSRGDSVLRIGNVSTAPPFGVLSNECANTDLEPEASCVVEVTFVPDALGVIAGEIRIETNAQGGLHVVPLTGTGTGDAELVLPERIDFGDVVPGQAPTQPLEIRNDGTAPVEITSVAVVPAPDTTGVEGSGDAFQVASDSCSQTTIGPGGVCIVELIFRPVTFAPYAAKLEVAHDAAEDPSTVELAGRGYDGDANLLGIAIIPAPLNINRSDDDGDGFFAVDFFVRISNAGPGTAGVFKIATHFESTEVIPVELRPVPGEPVHIEEPFVFTNEATPAGEDIPFEAQVFIPVEFADAGGTIVVELDSCVADETPLSGCRVPESNEEDNLLEAEIPALVTVGNYTGMTLGVARAAVEADGLVVEAVDPAGAPDSHSVFEQDLEEGSRVPAGSGVVLRTGPG